MTVGALGIVEGAEGEAVEGIEVDVQLLPDLGEARDGGREGTDAVAWDDAVHSSAVLWLLAAGYVGVLLGVGVGLSGWVVTGTVYSCTGRG